LTACVHRQNLVYINGFDHPNIIAGAGTMGIEILNQVPNVDAIIVPVGGAGLIAGIALAVKTLEPNVKVIVSLGHIITRMYLSH
jgi:threonine dehydratase